jgi:integrase
LWINNRENIEGTMGVRVRQKTNGKGNPWWVLISHNGKRTSRKVGDKKAAVASTIRAKLQLWEFGFDDQKPAPTFKEHAKMWLSLPHDWKESTRENYLNNLNNHILPYFGTMPVNEIKRKDLKSSFDKKYAHWMPGQFKSEVDELDNLHPSAPDTHP